MATTRFVAPQSANYTSFIRLKLAAVALLLAAVPGFAESQEPVYRIEKDRVEKDGRSEERLYVARRPDAQGKPILYVTVQFKINIADGQPAPDVSPDEIVVKEDGRPVSNLDIHCPTALDPLTSVLAIDTSGSMAEHGKMDESKNAARLFLDRLDTSAQCGLILFDHKLRVQEHPTKEHSQLRGHIDGATPRGGTAYLDATADAIGMLDKAKGRKAVVLLTDGVDLNSRLTLEETIDQARAANVPVYTIGVGEPGKNIPVTTVVVLDCSGSMNDPADDSDEISKMQALHQAAGRFIDIMRPGARTTLLPFDDDVGRPRPFTADKKELKQTLRGLEAGGQTALFDATYDAVRTLEVAHPEGKRAVVVLTDGKDNRSHRRAKEVIAAARKAEVPLHMLGLGRSGELDEEIMQRLAKETGGTYHHARNKQMLYDIFENLSIQLHDDGIDEAALRKLAEDTGGKYYPAQDISRLRFIYEGLAQELQTTYTVTFPSLRQDYDGTSRNIDISVWRKGVQVSDVLRGGYNVPGVVVPEMDSGVYLGLLGFLVGLLVLPVGLRLFYRRSATE